MGSFRPGGHRIPRRREPVQGFFRALRILERCLFPYAAFQGTAHLTVLTLLPSRKSPSGTLHLRPVVLTYHSRDIAYPDERLPRGYRHLLPPPLGAGNDCWNVRRFAEPSMRRPKVFEGRSWSTGGASEEREARAGWGLQGSLYVVETGEGGCSPLPVSPSPSGDIPTVQCPGFSHG